MKVYLSSGDRTHQYPPHLGDSVVLLLVAFKLVVLVGLSILRLAHSSFWKPAFSVYLPSRPSGQVLVLSLNLCSIPFF